METNKARSLRKLLAGPGMFAVLATVGCTTMGGGEPFIASPTAGRIEPMGATAQAG